ncbi:DUF1800 domain-containing protein [Nocardioides sp.]|uniref:DUF1800 domain-containing protein n=1 Tax=Nocardioides sp. TaxID=35761 RepID=UPI003566D349
MSATPEQVTPDQVAPATSRRTLLGQAAAVGVGGAVAALAVPAPAEAARYRPARYRGKRMLTRRGRLVLSRFSYGITPALAAQVRKQGGWQKWFDKQLTPDRINDSQMRRYDAWWPELSRGPEDLWVRSRNGGLRGSQVMLSYERWVLTRRMYTRRQLLEVMTEFWENHFNVPAIGNDHFVHRKAYGDAIRARALGSFEDLLGTVITHPAMLLYLDNAVSTAKAPNENLGRELLELHTVGRGNYGEDDVKSSARILTGWTCDIRGTWAPRYVAENHWRGPVRVMGFSDPNAAADGRELTRRYLGYLAHHPATAQRIARRLAVKFVRDNPPQALVDRLATVYLDNDTRIAPVLRALIASPEFADSTGAKVKDPGEDLVSTYRALRVRLLAPKSGSDAANQMLWQADNMGAMPFEWPAPDGQPIDNETWSNPSRLLGSMETHYALSGTWWPREGVRYRKHRAWVPTYPIRFDRLVDHLSQELLHRRSTAELLEACCAAVDVRPRERITRQHALVRYQMPRLLTTFLDSPYFLTR